MLCFQMKLPGHPRRAQEKQRTKSKTMSMGRVHTSHSRWVRGDVISGKVGQDEKDIEEICR